jgi:exonuclease SbcC
MPTEKLNVINSLENKLYLPQQQRELEEVKVKLTNLDYNQETYSMVKKNERKYHWAGVKFEELQKAEKKLSKLEQNRLSLQENLQTSKKELDDLKANSPLQLQINQLEEKIKEINYSDHHHSLLKSNLEKLQPYQLKYLQLQEAKTQLPKLEQKLGSNTRKHLQYQEEIAEKQLKINKVKEQLSQLFDYSQELKKLESESNDRKSKINQLLGKKGGLEQSLTNLENNEKELLEISEQIKIVQKNQRVYNELVKAFGKNGIQALMIENILPQLEAEANQILSRLTNNQLHIQFVTQKLKASSGKKSNPDFKDTLDIIISDIQGTRSYETYSGGESFRINFSIRLALSRILAQRSGTALQLLIIDEGFGTQDDKGCDRLISALNNISQDFACILTVTHMPQFKEAFQSRIEVYKTDQGSKIRLSV